MRFERGSRSAPGRRRVHAGRSAGLGRRIALYLFLALFAATAIIWPDSVYAGFLGPDGLILDARF